VYEKWVRSVVLLAGIPALVSVLVACAKLDAGEGGEYKNTVLIESAPWVSDLGNGTYKNPIIHADYSDPDAIRVGDTYYMTSSSFNSAPGLPLLKSRDLVNWKLVGHALQQQVPRDHYATPRHGEGVWAPTLRYHDDKFWIFYPDPDFGIYVITAKHFEGPWSEPHLLLPGKGIIDPAPLWDDDGKAYLIHAWAKSRAGFNNMLTLREMAPDASRLLDGGGRFVVNGHMLGGYRTLEGPKLYKRNGYYYIFAPSGGVEFGDQSIFRSRNIWGPYKDRIVLSQGDTPINGPHQGSWVTTPSGENWFLHFQQKGVYGRIVHLQPMSWRDDWPLMGANVAAEGALPVGTPVLQHSKPDITGGPFPLAVPPTSDLFEQASLGLQWQWNANWDKRWYSLTARPGYLRLYAQKDSAYSDSHNMWLTPSLLLQKLPAPEFRVTTRLQLQGSQDRDRAGLLIYGYDYAWLGITQVKGELRLVYVTCKNAREGCREETKWSLPLEQSAVSLRLTLRSGGQAQFAYSLAGESGFVSLDERFTASEGRWVGGKIGLFAATEAAASNAFADFEQFVLSAL
jgi:beta-xylosidase